MRRLLALVALILAAAGPALAGSPFAGWGAVVVAGDYHAAHADRETEAFDNARRDVVAELVRVGFSPAHIRQFSVRPERYPKTAPQKTDGEAIYAALRDVAAQAPQGCLIYFSSHGAPQGVLIGDRLLPPAILAQMLDAACGARPTIAVISACFSGVFVPALAAPNRMVLTAARPDRSSFGCSEDDKYPYFDTCVLQLLPTVHDFAALGPAAQACVAKRENDTGMSPPSEPQVSIGSAIKPLLPLMAFPKATLAQAPN